jgi:hypothetical protein
LVGQPGALEALELEVLLLLLVLVREALCSWIIPAPEWWSCGWSHSRWGTSLECVELCPYACAIPAAVIVWPV